MRRLLDGVAVLVVEDDEDNLELLDFVLRDGGATVTTARTAAEARKLLLEKPLPDVIVSDLSLPDENGCALMEWIRANPTTTHVPAIALTGHAETSFLVRAVKAGFQRLITKPVDIPDLLGPVAGLIGRDPGDTGAHRMIVRDELIGLIARGELRALVAVLNGQAPHRFTSFCRFRGDAVEPIATFDRESGAEASTVATVATSYCAFVRSQRAPFVVENAAFDPRVATHSLRSQVHAYCGVPVLRRDGTVFGSLFHSDFTPRPANSDLVAKLEGVASMLSSELGPYEVRAS